MKKLVVVVKIFFLPVFFVIIFSQSLMSQELSRTELEEASLAFFNKSDYARAQSGFEELISIYPKEVSYNYYLGRCYLHQNINSKKAINNLRFAASKNYKANSHYFLSIAYFRNYQFDDAEIALVNFINLAKNKDLLTYKPDVLLASINKAREETYMAPSPKVITREEISTLEIETVYALHIPGKFVLKDKAFMQKSDLKEDYQGLMYIPVYSPNGYKYFITSIGKSSRTGKDLFQVKQLTGINFSLPKELKSINSKYNEEYPYFDYNSQTLYFSSDRSGGMGGYDIYKSVYNQQSESFSEPKRLEFPINSPYDDFLYVPDSTGKTAIFLSNRNNKSNRLTAYKIEVNDAPTYVFPKSNDEIIELASLEVKFEKEMETVIVENLSPAKQPEIKTEYDLLIQEALLNQLKCDSLQAVIISGKNRLRIEENIDNKRLLTSAISLNQKMLATLQSETNELFAKAEYLKSGEPNNVENTNRFTVTNPDTSSTFALVDNSFAVFDTTQVLKVEESRLDAQFDILEKSPYSEAAPIPYSNELPDGLIYRIQLGAFSQKLPVNKFGGLTPLSAEKNDEKRMIKYYVGYFASSKEARKALDRVKSYGFGDAFLVPYYNKSKITIQAAREIEFGNKQ